MYYDDSTLSYETAFTGIEGSLPESLVPGETYEVELEAPIPSLGETASEIHMVAFVIDAVTGELLNAVSDSQTAGAGICEAKSSCQSAQLSMDKEGNVRTDLEKGIPYFLEVFTPDGVRMIGRSGVAEGNDSFSLPSVAGILIVRLSSPNGSRTLKAFRSL